MRTFVGWIFRGMIFIGSGHYVKIKGKRADPKEAPILIGAPHTSFFDSLAVVMSGPSCVVGKIEAGDILFYGSKCCYFFFKKKKLNNFVYRQKEKES